MPFGDHEMLKAPVNVNGHGRYNGIRYLSSGYCCIVLWKDEYFEFVDKTREILDCPAGKNNGGESVSLF